MKKIFQNSPVPTLTTGPDCGILCVTGFNNPVDSGRCLRHGGNLRTTQNATALLAGLRERSCESMSGTTIDVLLTPSQVRLFCTGRNKPGKAVKSSSIGGRIMLYYYNAAPRICAKFPYFQLDRSKDPCYFICNGLGNPRKSGGSRRQGRQFHSKNHIFSPFGAIGPDLSGRVFCHVSNPVAPFSCLGKRGKGNRSPQQKEA